MRFGDQSEFAIEADVEPDLKRPSAVWGHMCVWCGGVALGELNDRYCALYPAYRHFGELSIGLDHLWAEELSGLDDSAAWNFLDGLLYGHHGDVEVPDDRTAEECARDWLVWGRFNFLTNWGEQFDGYQAFIMCPPGGVVKILYRRLSEPVVRSVQVSRDAVLAAAEGFTRWFEEQARRLEDGRA